MYDLVPGDVISGSIAFTGFFEWELTKRIAQHATAGGLFVDVGANMGYFTLLWAGLAPDGKAVAFEASPRNVALLTNNIRRNQCDDRATVVGKAAGDRAGEVSFDTGPADQTGWGGIAPGALENTIRVPMVRLDDELGEQRIAVLKIDTEGADPLVLFGCQRLLEGGRIGVIYFEQNADKLDRIGLDARETQQFLRRSGYECRALDRDGTEWMAYPA
jgi:FkbM family methyltransferase